MKNELNAEGVVRLAGAVILNAVTQSHDPAKLEKFSHSPLVDHYVSVTGIDEKRLRERISRRVARLEKFRV